MIHEHALSLNNPSISYLTLPYLISDGDEQHIINIEKNATNLSLFS